MSRINGDDHGQITAIHCNIITDSINSLVVLQCENVKMPSSVQDRGKYRCFPAYGELIIEIMFETVESVLSIEKKLQSYSMA